LSQFKYIICGYLELLTHIPILLFFIQIMTFANAMFSEKMIQTYVVLLVGRYRENKL